MFVPTKIITIKTAFALEGTTRHREGGADSDIGSRQTMRSPADRGRISRHRYLIRIGLIVNVLQSLIYVSYVFLCYICFTLYVIYVIYVRLRRETGDTNLKRNQLQYFGAVPTGMESTGSEFGDDKNRGRSVLL